MVDQSMDNHALEEHRRLKNEFFAAHAQSPIRAEDRDSFEGLSYYAPNPDVVYVVVPDRTEPEDVAIGTTTGGERTYTRVATAAFTIAGVDVTLGLFSTGHPGLFLPFRDTTSGKDTYGAGRYLDLEPGEDGSVTIDFNYAYAPFCAYNDAYSCALPPIENWLEVTIEAGERLPSREA
ncbi:MAG: DUF1684 domain-containing protein [Acidimicrobiia bacterium]